LYKCGICNHELNDDIFVIDNVPEHTFDISDKTLTLNIAKCDNCGVVQLVDVPLSDTWMENNRSIGNTVEYREKKKEELKHFIDTYKLQDKAFLEVGCGDGQYLDIFRELGIESSGIESGKKNVDICTGKKYKIHGICFYNSIDVITCFYYLEHQPYPIMFLKSLNKALKTDGLLYIEVPNYDYIKDHGLWLEFTRDHRFYYSLNSIYNLLLKCGFDILESDKSNLCLKVLAQKKNEFGKLKYCMADEIERFNVLTDRLNQYAIVGAGHYTQLLLNQITNKPKYIYDSVPKKVGYKLCGIEIQHQNNIVNCDCNNIIISCGMYNQEAYNNIKKLVPEKNIIIWE